MDLGVKGYIPTGMLDWEGKIASTMFISGCGFRCPYCHNPGLAAKSGNEADISWSHIENHLKNKGDWLDGVVISGGEPTTYELLPEIILRVKNMGFAVKLDTNGSNPDMLEELLANKYLDFVAIDIKSTWDKYPIATGMDTVDIEPICRSIRIMIDSGVPHEFRTTVVPGLVEAAEALSIAHTIQGAQAYYLQQFNPEVTLSAKYGLVKPFSAQELERIASACSEYVTTRVRGI